MLTEDEEEEEKEKQEKKTTKKKKEEEKINKSRKNKRHINHNHNKWKDKDQKWKKITKKDKGKMDCRLDSYALIISLNAFEEQTKWHTVSYPQSLSTMENTSDDTKST